MKFSEKRNSLILSLSLACIPSPSVAMDVVPPFEEIKTVLSRAHDYHQQTHKNQQFGYVKFDIQLDEKNSITPWVILPEDWIPAFNGHLHAYYPEINSEVSIKPKQATDATPSMSLPDQFFQRPLILAFENELDLCKQLQHISEGLTHPGLIVPVVVISQSQESQFIAWIEKNHPDLLHSKLKSSNPTSQPPTLTFRKEQRNRATQKLLWKILGGARKSARVTTKVALGTVSVAVGGTAGLVVGTAGASAGGVIYSFMNQMRGAFGGGRSNSSGVQDFLIGTALSPFVGAGLGGYAGLNLTNTIVDSVDEVLYGKQSSSSH
ncbi:hypothetical protein [Candidatus Odyssella acanthamoebae]|uniref:Uncharacterized protein n=1 Tax=Candidatus Odyssella acanthamoebae TaxID=91604 RepID=A0A077AS67_9PROT|nr:hypothetical protein [Candidatus Paracaedibacter acanthamoebae]AIK96012.1 hypothetical protein ID47_03545 [Candidatus Paracaedibacter acanthamoebae]